MTITATMAKATLSQAISFSRCKSHLSSGVIVAIADGSARDMASKDQLLTASPGSGSIWRVCFTGLPHEHQSGLKTIIDFEFIENVGQVSFYGLLTNKDFFTNLLVSKPFGHQPEYL